MRFTIVHPTWYNFHIYMILHEFTLRYLIRLWIVRSFSDYQTGIWSVRQRSQLSQVPRRIEPPWDITISDVEIDVTDILTLNFRVPEKKTKSQKCQLINTRFQCQKCQNEIDKKQADQLRELFRCVQESDDAIKATLYCLHALGDDVDNFNMQDSRISHGD